MIYFIQAGKNGPIKIGYTETNVHERLKQLQTACPYELKLLWCIEGSQQEESNIHDRFGYEKVRGEWFHPSRLLLNFIEEDAKNIWEIEYANLMGRGCLLAISESKKELLVEAGGWSVSTTKNDFDLDIYWDDCINVHIETSHIKNDKHKIHIHNSGIYIESNGGPYDGSKITFLLVGEKEVVVEK